jgi:hypothetical protein
MSLDPMKLVGKFTGSKTANKIDFKAVAKNLIKLHNILGDEESTSKKASSINHENYELLVQGLFNVYADKHGNASASGIHEDMGNMLEDPKNYNDIHKKIDEGVKKAIKSISSAVKSSPTDRSVEDVVDTVFSELASHMNHYLTEFRISNKSRSGGDHKINHGDDLKKTLKYESGKMSDGEKAKHKKKRKEVKRGAYISIGTRGLMESNKDLYNDLEHFYNQQSHLMPDEEAMRSMPTVELEIIDDADARGVDTQRGETFVPDKMEGKEVKVPGQPVKKSDTKVAVIKRVGNKHYSIPKNPTLGNCDSCTFVSSARQNIGEGGQKTSELPLRVGKTYELVFGPYSDMKSGGKDSNLMLKIKNNAHKHEAEELNLGIVEIPKFLGFAASTITNALHKKGKLHMSSEALDEEDEYKSYQNKSYEDLADIPEKSRTLMFQDDLNEALKGGQVNRAADILSSIYSDLSDNQKSKHEDPGIRDLINMLSSDKGSLRTNEVREEILGKFDSIHSIMSNKHGTTPDDFIHEAAFSKEIISKVLDILLGDHSVVSNSKNIESVIRSTIQGQLSDKKSPLFNMFINTSHAVQSDGKKDTAKRHNSDLSKKHPRIVSSKLQDLIDSNRSAEYVESVEDRIHELYDDGKESLVKSVFRPNKESKKVDEGIIKEAKRSVTLFNSPEGPLIAKTNININDFNKFFVEGPVDILNGDMLSNEKSLSLWWEVDDLTSSTEHVEEDDVSSDVSLRLFKSPKLKELPKEILDFTRHEIEKSVGVGEMRNMSKLVKKLDTYTKYQEKSQNISSIFDIDDAVQYKGIEDGSSKYNSAVKNIYKTLGMPTQEKIYKEVQGDPELSSQFGFLPKPSRAEVSDPSKGRSKYLDDADLGVSRSQGIKDKAKKDMIKNSSHNLVLIRSLMSRMKKEEK